ncbi:MAG: hypothetical protein J7K40_08145 [candidate division Zixibacteria bacterium]|nr:hypothetical protein [candidate division Zixibacteria bacterium]
MISCLIGKPFKLASGLKTPTIEGYGLSCGFKYWPDMLILAIEFNAKVLKHSKVSGISSLSASQNPTTTTTSYSESY